MGDNLEWDDVIYHIEGIQHSGHIDQAGRKTFDTVLSLSNGVRSCPLALASRALPCSTRSMKDGCSLREDIACASRTLADARRPTELKLVHGGSTGRTRANRCLAGLARLLEGYGGRDGAKGNRQLSAL